MTALKLSSANGESLPGREGGWRALYAAKTALPDLRFLASLNGCAATSVAYFSYHIGAVLRPLCTMDPIS